MARKKVLDKPRKVRTTAEELEVLARLSGSVEWAILKRVLQRYVHNLTLTAFNLSYSYSGEDFKVRHRELTAEANGLKKAVSIVKYAGKRLDKLEDKD